MIKEGQMIRSISGASLRPIVSKVGRLKSRGAKRCKSYLGDGVLRSFRLYSKDLGVHKLSRGLSYLEQLIAKLSNDC